MQIWIGRSGKFKKCHSTKVGSLDILNVINTKVPVIKKQPQGGALQKTLIEGGEVIFNTELFQQIQTFNLGSNHLLYAKNIKIEKEKGVCHIKLF